MAEPLCREAFYGEDYKLVVIDRGNRGMWGQVILLQGGASRMIFNQRFPSSGDHVMAYLQVWSQQHQYGNLVEGDHLPYNLLGQVKLMAAPESAMYWPAHPSMM